MWRSFHPDRLVLAIFLVSCSPDTPTRANAPLATSGSARLLPLSGTVLRLGSSDPQAAPEEAPGWTRFKHDLWMDTTELPQALFQSLLGRNPSALRGDSLPVTDVSWFDAALCANARSRRDGLDSVYEYASVSLDSTGNALDLQGLAIHLDKNGWRLPTEAEWEAAARAGSSTAYAWGSLADSALAAPFAWFSRNSGSTIHPVATRKPNSWGLHDMAGNAMEWVQDWKGRFPEDTLDDYAGLDSPEDIPAVPLKGGAFNYGLPNLRPSSRTATYAAYKGSRASYVGFRLVRGAFHPTYGTPSGQAVDAPAVSIDLTDLPATLGAVAAKIVFLNRSNGKNILSWIDFSESNPAVRTLPDKDPVFHPVISPDGRWVVWSTVLEGSPSAGRIKARRLARSGSTVLDLGAGGIPRFWVHGTDTFLVQASPVDNSEQTWSTAGTTVRKWSSSGTLDPQQDVWAPDGAFHDGRTGPFLYTGYKRLKRYDTRTGTTRILFTAPQNGKVPGDTSQVCNVSAAPDSSGDVLFLDFGYSGTSTVVGTSYGIHEVAFVADSLGNVQRKIPVPGEWTQWDHLEWSNHPRWAVSSALDGTGAAKAVFLLDLQTNSTRRILHGSDLWQPQLWMGGGTTLGRIALDSALAYDSPLSDIFQGEFNAKASSFLARHDSFEVVAVGSSHVSYGISPSDFSVPAFDFGVQSGPLALDETTVIDLILPHAARLTAVVLNIMPGWLLWSGEQTVAIGVHQSTGWIYDRSHGFWRDSLPQELVSIARTRDWTMGGNILPSGQVQVPTRGWAAGSHEEFHPTDFRIDGPLFKANWDRLRRIVDSTKAHGVRLLLVRFPVSPAYRGSPWPGRYEPDWDTYHAILDTIRTLERDHSNVRFYDANMDGLHDYTDSEAWDEEHLSATGASKISRRLDSILTRWK